MGPYFKSFLLLLLVLVLVEQCRPSEPDDHDNKPEYQDPQGRKPSKVEIKAKPSDTSRGALGQGFQIHKEDLLTKQFPATGAKIFEELPMGECTKNTKLGEIQRDESYYSSTKSLYQSISTSTKISGSLQGEYTLGASVKAVTNNVASGQTKIQGASLDLKAYSLSASMKQDCINKKPLATDLVRTFESLPKEVKNPWQRSSWRQYTAFLDKYGSHFVKETISGSSIYQYVFAKSDKNFKKKDFTSTACLSLAGPTESGKLGISACSGVSDTSVDSSKSSEMVKKLVVRGGKSKTRADLTGELKATQINQFLKEAVTDPSPIQYYFEPIWSLLKTRYVGQEHFAKAANLEQFYKGFLHFGCPHRKTTNDVDMQKFELATDSDPQAPTYVCKLGPEGCHKNDDCHTNPGLWCSCSGDSCLRYKDTELASGSIKKEAYVFKEPGWGWHGCEHFASGCYCSDEKKIPTRSWSGEDFDNSLRDVHSMLLDKNRRDQAKRHKC